MTMKHKFKLFIFFLAVALFCLGPVGARDYSVMFFSGDEETYTTVSATDPSTGGFGFNGVQRTIITSTDHGFKANSYVWIDGTTYYDGMRYIEAVAANTITVRGAYTAENTAGTETIKAAVYVERPWELLGFQVHLNTASATSENLVVAVDAEKGSSYDVKLYSKDMNGIQDVVYKFDPPEPMEPKDVVTFTWANTNDTTWTIRAFYREK
jgi:hypothetical protein